jgi:hypothetical protein
MSAPFTLRPIGVLSTPWQTLDQCPRNGRQPDPAPVCQARVLPENGYPLHPSSEVRGLPRVDPMI